jgi:ACS family glucarate transporter-like MFS transporter
MIAYIQRNSLGVAEKEVRASLGLNDREMGFVLGAFFFPYAFLQIPGGWAVQRWGSRRLLPLWCLLGALATALLGLAPGLLVLFAARLGLGAAQAGLFPCTTDVFSKWFPSTQRAIASGCLTASMSVGGAVGAYLTGLLVPAIGWRWPFLIFAVPGMLWAAWFYTWFRDRPQDHSAVTQEELLAIGSSPAPRKDVSTPWLALASSPALLCICGQQFFRAAGYIFYSTWFTTYLRESRDVSLQDAGLLTSLPLLGYVLGSLVGGIFSDIVLSLTGSRRLGRQGVALVVSLLAGLVILFARPVEDAWTFVLLVSFGSFLASWAGPCAYAITIDMGGRHVAPVFATMNMTGNIGATLFPVVVPYLVGAEGNWDLVLYVFAGMHIAAALLWAGFDSEGTIVREDASDESPDTP